jgi:hypothetical protein
MKKRKIILQEDSDKKFKNYAIVKILNEISPRLDILQI